MWEFVEGQEGQFEDTLTAAVRIEEQHIAEEQVDAGTFVAKTVAGRIGKEAVAVVAEAVVVWYTAGRARRALPGAGWNMNMIAAAALVALGLVAEPERTIRQGHY